MVTDKNPDPNNVVDPKLIPKPKRIEIMFYSYGPDLKTGDWGLTPNFRISFQFDKNVTVLDHPTEFFGSLGEERADFVPMDDWRLFDLVIRCVNRRLRIYVNNYEFANYELGRSIEGTDHIGVTGDVEVLGFTGNTLDEKKSRKRLACFEVSFVFAMLALLFYLKICNNHPEEPPYDSLPDIPPPTEPPEPPPEVIHFFGEAKLPDPNPLLGTRITLNNSATVGQYLHILGNTTENATSFCVTLSEDFDIDANYACGVCAYFGADPKIEYAAYNYGKRIFNGTGLNPFTPGEQFDLRIRFLQDYVQIFAERGEIGIFGKLHEVHEAKSLKIIGNITNLLLLQLAGGNYTMPFYQPIKSKVGLRLDMVLKPVPEMDPSLWAALIEGQPLETATNSSIRVKRKGGYGTSYGRSTMGAYWYSPMHGGYYHTPPIQSSTTPTARFYSPASYSYRNAQNNGTMEYSLSDGHGQNPDPNNVVDPKLIPKPKRIEITLYSFGPDPEKDYHWGLARTFRLSFQFDKNMTAMNRYSPLRIFNDVQQADFVPMDDWRLFDLSIQAASDRLRIYVNNYEFANYELDAVRAGIDHIGINGDVEVLGFEGNTQIIDILFYKAGDNTTDPAGLMPTFKVSFHFSQNATTLSRRVLQNWVNEERANFVPMDDWRIFDLVIRSAEDRLKIYVNNFEFANYELYPEIKASEHIGITGDVEVLGFKENATCLTLLPYSDADIFNSPQEIQFWDEKLPPPKIGQYIHLVGNLKPGAKWFCVTLAGKFDSPGVSSSVCAIFGSDAKIIYEAYRGEKRIYQNEATNPISEPVKSNPKIDLRIRFLAEYVQIFAQRGEVGIFRKLPEVHTFRFLQLTGDVINPTLMNVDGARYRAFTSVGFKYGARLDMAMLPMVTVEPAVWESLIEGGATKRKSTRVKRQSGRGGGGRGSASGNDRWQQPDQSNFLPIDNWRLFDVSIKPVDGHLKIYINNFEFASYEENVQIKASNICSIYGDVEVLTLKADGKILAPEWGALPKKQ
ncbi:unnamed protein product, partial [Mesorhabditis spiculigera]